MLLGSVGMLQRELEAVVLWSGARPTWSTGLHQLFERESCRPLCLFNQSTDTLSQSRECKCWNGVGTFGRLG
jgi:hypothetical protein